jgi:RHS repeat-associated protein
MSRLLVYLTTKWLRSVALPRPLPYRPPTMPRYRLGLWSISMALVLATFGGALIVGSAPKKTSYEPSQPIGNFAGVFAVDGNGSATYSLDVQVPPGTAGATPLLQITYDSHRSNGYLGMGWALSGISAISRCSASFRTDGFKSGVNYASADRFCLDGRRLIAVSGANGADGTVYHTETETWTIVTSHGKCGSGPCSFTATNKDGKQLSFGGTSGPSGSRILAQGRMDGSVQTWSIDTLTDLNGNATLVQYFSDPSSGEYYPTRIDYTSNAMAGLAASRSIRFKYNSRPDVIRRFMGGAQVEISKLLDSIETYVSYAGQDQLVLAYRFAYSTSPVTSRSRLDKITKCDASAVCWPPLSFSWYDSNTTFDPTSSSLPGPTSVVYNGKVLPYGMLLDFNGDGIADYSQGTEFVGGRQDLSVYLGQKDGSFKISDFKLPGPIWRVTSKEIVQVGTLQDINGDGILDYTAGLLNDDGHTHDYVVHLGSGQGFLRQPDYELPGPLFWQVNQNTYQSGILSDLNGDGIPDYSRATRLLATGQVFLDIYKGTGTGFVSTGKTLPGPVYTIGPTASLVSGILRDINGDGIVDYSAATINAQSGHSDLRVFVGESPNFVFSEQFSLPGQLFWVSDGKALESGALVDVNGDGIPDFSRATRIEATGQQLLDVNLGTGAGFTPPAMQLPGPLYSILNKESFIQGVLTDWNGDGTTRYSRATQFADGRSDLAVFLGSGVGFAPAGFSLPKAMYQVISGSGTGGTYPKATYQDINGDGLTDFVDSVCGLNADGTFSNCSLGVQLASGPFPELLRGITNGFGGTTSIEYRPLTSDVYLSTGRSSYPIRKSEGPMIVVSKFTSGDGRGGSYGYSYSYVGARSDVLGNGWLGFQSVLMKELATGKTSTIEYMQQLPFYGLVAASKAFDPQGNLIAQTTFAYRDIADVSRQALNIHQPVRIRETYSPMSKGVADYTLTKSFEYDAWGNTTLSISSGDAAADVAPVFQCIRYLNSSDTGRFGYILQSKNTRTEQGCRNFLAPNDPALIVWDPQEDLAWTRKTYDARLNIRIQEIWDDSNAVFLTDSFTVDDVGNLLTATNQAGNTTTYEYDVAFRTFRIRSTSPTMSRGGKSYNLITATNYEPAFGVLLSTTDPNGNTTSQRIDGFGRPVKVYGPGPQGQPTLLVTTSWGAAQAMHWVEVRQRPDWQIDDESVWYWDRQYIDGMNRQYREERSTTRTGKPAVIATDIVYDSAGRVRQSSAPYFVGDPVPYTTTTYDDYNRPTLISDPAGVQLKVDYSTGGLKVNRTNAFDTPDAQTEVTYYSGNGMVRQSVAPNGLVKSYVYDQLGRLTSSTTSPSVRSAQFSYDSVSRVRELNATDTGRSRWAFGKDGYLYSMTDASGNSTVISEYDQMGRVRARSMSYAGKTSQVTFTFDDPASSNGLGNLTSLQSVQEPIGSLSYTYSYTPFGQVSSGGMEIAQMRFAYASIYDPLGRVVQSTNPDGSQFSLSYSSDQNLASISVKESAQEQWKVYALYPSYTAMGQPLEEMIAPPAIQTTNSYFPIGQSFGQLKSTTSARAAGVNAQTYYAKSFTWNRLNALQTLIDSKTPSANESYGYKDQSINANMGYLTSATGAYPEQSIRYDLLGNPIEKTGVTLNYAPGKDWLTSTSAGREFTYYDNGNLRSQSDGGTTTSFTYDAGGLLVKADKTGPGTSTQTSYLAYDPFGRMVFAQLAGERRKTYWVTKYFEVTDLGNNSFQNTVYVPGGVTPIAAITKPGIGNTFMIGGWADGIAPNLGEWLAAWSTSTVSLAHIASQLVFTFVLLTILASSAHLYARRFREEPTGRLRATYRAAIPLLILSMLATSAPAQMSPGANGTGVPTPGYRFFVTNHLGSVVKVTDETGAVTAEVSYLPDGAIFQQGSSGTDDFRPKFVGAQWDPTIALYRMGIRYYDPNVSRFLSPDPAAQYTSPYTYAGNSPVSAIDPNGDFAFAVAIIVGAIVGAYFGGATVNHDMNPLHWNWSAGKTYAGLFGGASIGSVGAAFGGLAVEAGIALGASGGLAAQAGGVAVGITGQVLAGAGENAAFSALGGGSSKEIIEAAGQGALWSGAFAVAGEAIGGMASQFARRSGAAGEAGQEAGAARRAAGEAEEELGSGDFCSASFVAGTPVVTESGERRSIENIAVGDSLKTSKPGSAVDDRQPVTELVRRSTNHLIDISIESGETLSVTSEHPFKLRQRGWVEAQYLAVGEVLDGDGGKPIKILSVRQYQTDNPVAVFNFEVATDHNYRVGEAGVLVHNPKQSKGRVCRARYDPLSQTVTEEWSISELKARYPKSSDYQAIQRDIRAKARGANKFISSGKVAASTRIGKPVRTASKEWVRWRWQQKYGLASTPPKSIRAALAVLRSHHAAQDVDEYLSRIHGGLTIREGAPENQGPLNSFVNQTSGAAMGALSRSIPPQPVSAIKSTFVPSL